MMPWRLANSPKFPSAKAELIRNWNTQIWSQIQPRSQTSLQGIREGQLRPLEIGSDFAINDKRRTFSSKEERHLKAHYSILVTVLSKMIRFDFQNRKFPT